MTTSDPAARPPILLLALAALLAMASTPVGATDTNMGTIKVHDDAAAAPPQRNEPHVSCDFWIEGFGMADTSGILVFWSWAPTGNTSVVFAANWTGTPETDGHGSHFLAGPFNFTTPGHYRVEAFSSTGHPGSDEHFAKAKMFWVDPCTPAGSPPPLLACPTALEAIANPDGSITLTFTPAAGSNGTLVYRANATGDFEPIATLGPGETSYTDSTATPGTVYEYTLTALFADRESVGCAIAAVTPIPDFPTPLAIGLAAVAGIAAYVGFRRRG